MKTLRHVFVALLITCVLAASAYAAAVNKVIVLGDSLSDNGNLYALTGHAAPPMPPYWMGRASNGPVAVEYLSQKLGFPLQDFAWYGATTGVGNYADDGTVDSLGDYGWPGMKTALQNMLAAGPVDPNALYVIWGGPNDFWDVTPPGAETAISKAVTNLLTIVGTLQSLGAKEILVAGMPDLGSTPLMLGQPYAPFFTYISISFNQALQASLPPGVRYFNNFALFASIIANPPAYGFMNVTIPFLYVPGADPKDFLFYDPVHPTTAGHKVIGDALYNGVQDIDGDGVPIQTDQCPGSILAPTVIIGGCNSGAPNVLLGTGCTVSDLIGAAAAGAKNHGQFVSAVATITNGLAKSGAISGNQKGAIQSCAAKASIP